MITLRKPEYITSSARINWQSRFDRTCQLAKELGQKVVVKVKAQTRKA